MNRLVIPLALLLIAIPAFCHAEWMSDVDKKYKKSNPALYAQVSKAEALISDAKGQTDMNEQALNILNAAIKTDPKFAPTYVQLARVTLNLGYQASGKYDADALKLMESYVRKALTLEPHYDYAIAMMGLTNFMQGNLDEAEKYYQQAINEKSGYPFLKSQMADLALQRGNLKKALELARSAYEENKSNTNPRVTAGTITSLIFVYQELKEDHNEELEKLQTERTKIAPNVGWYWGDHARFRLFFVGDYEGAIKYGEQALSMMNYGVGRYTLAAAYYAKWADLDNKKIRSTEAEEAWRKGEKLYPLSLEMTNNFLGNRLLVMTGVALSRKLAASANAVQAPK